MKKPYVNLEFGKYQAFDLSNKGVDYDELASWCWDRWATHENDWILEHRDGSPTLIKMAYLLIKEKSKIDLTEFKLRWL